MSLLCGPDKWTEAARAQKKRCQKICRFRRSLIDSLRGFAESTTTLGLSLEEAMRKVRVVAFSWSERSIAALTRQQDLLDPLEYNVFYVFGRWPKVTFPKDDFFLGIDLRVQKLLAHVDNCFEKHGEDIYIDLEDP